MERKKSWIADELTSQKLEENEQLAQILSLEENQVCLTDGVYHIQALLSSKHQNSLTQPKCSSGQSCTVSSGMVIRVLQHSYHLLQSKETMPQVVMLVNDWEPVDGYVNFRGTSDNSSVSQVTVAQSERDSQNLSALVSVACLDNSNVSSSDCIETLALSQSITTLFSVDTGSNRRKLGSNRRKLGFYTTPNASFMHIRQRQATGAIQGRHSITWWPPAGEISHFIHKLDHSSQPQLISGQTPSEICQLEDVASSQLLEIMGDNSQEQNIVTSPAGNPTPELIQQTNGGCCDQVQFRPLDDLAYLIVADTDKHQLSHLPDWSYSFEPPVLPSIISASPADTINKSTDSILFSQSIMNVLQCPSNVCPSEAASSIQDKKATTLHEIVINLESDRTCSNQASEKNWQLNSVNSEVLPESVKRHHTLSSSSGMPRTNSSLGESIALTFLTRSSLHKSQHQKFIIQEPVLTRALLDMKAVLQKSCTVPSPAPKSQLQLGYSDIGEDGKV